MFQYGHKDALTMSRNSFRTMVRFGLAAHIAAAWDFADPGSYSGFATTRRFRREVLSPWRKI